MITIELENARKPEGIDKELTDVKHCWSSGST